MCNGHTDSSGALIDKLEPKILATSLRRRALFFSLYEEGLGLRVLL